MIQRLYNAGQRLPAVRILAEEMNVSRATIRTALLRLQAKNLIEMIPRGDASTILVISDIKRLSRWLSTG
ncbi:GntR family transcriptional regulator [Seinonella peptonophila]|nr:GntR family transcriptional regulator [Seinonella peptonophila]